MYTAIFSNEHNSHIRRGNTMGKIDELERMLEEAKREEAEKNNGWIKLVIYFFIFILIIRGCSSDNEPQTQEQTTIEQSAESLSTPSSEQEDDTDQAQNDDQIPIHTNPKHEKTPEEKLETMTGEKIDNPVDNDGYIESNSDSEPNMEAK